MKPTRYIPRAYLLPICAAVAVTTMIVTATIRPLDFALAWAQTAQPGCQTFRETGKTICGTFLRYWQQHGGLAQQGYPISNEFQEKSDLDGKEYRVQYFERAVFELHPENPPPYDVLLSQLGTYRFKDKYSGVEPGVPAPTPVPPPGLNTRVTLKEGVTITLVPRAQYDWEATGLDQCRAMNWWFRVENTTSSPYTVSLDQGSISMLDDTGRTYALGGPCGGDLSDLFRSARTLAARDAQFGLVRFNVKDTPASITYYDLRMTLSGQPLTFRFPLR